MRRFLSAVGLAVVLAFCFLHSPAWAQSSGTTTGDLKGRVFDDKQQPVPGATVTATNKETGVSRSTVSKLGGEYVIPLLSPGVYRVTAEVALYNPATFDNVRLSLGSTATVDFTLVVTQTATAAVEVTAEVPLIDTSSTDISSTVDRGKLESLPNVARNFLSFSLITPRVAEDRGPQTGAAASSGFSINGQSPRYNNLAVDGFDNNDAATGGVRATFSQDAIQEYQVITNPYAAEFGRTAGGVINIITRSGTNTFRGSAFYFYRSDSLATKDPITGQTVPLKDHRFGLSAGGPLVKDRTFFFTAYEHQGTDTANAVAITDADVALIRSQGFAVENGNVPYEQRRDNVVLKIDHSFSPSLLLTVRGNWEKGKNGNEQTWGGLVARSAGGIRDNRDTSGALSLTSVFGTTAFNELRGLYSDASYEVKPLDEGYGVSVTLPGVATFGTQRLLPQPRDTKITQVFDAFSLELSPKVRLKLGAEYDRFQLSGSLPNFFAGLYRFSALPPIPGLAPNGLTVRQAFGAGVPAVFIQAFGDPTGSDSLVQFGAFAQTDLTLSPEFLLRLGVRYDYEKPIAPFTSDNNVSPRISFSYSPTQSIRVKGGYGRFYGVSALGPMFAASVLDGVRVRTQIRSILGGPSPLVPWRLPQRRFPNEASAGVGVLPQFILRPGEFQSTYSDQVSLGMEASPSNKLLLSLDGVYTRGKNVFIARNINPITNPTGTPATQRPDPRYSDIYLYESAGNSWYTGATLGLATRLGGPFDASVYYTYAKAEDDYIDWLTEFQPQDPLNEADERAPSVQSPDQKLIVTATYSTVGREMNAFLRDWTFAAIVDWRNGIHYNITAGYDRNRNGDPLSDRPPGYRRNAGSLGSQFSLDLRLSRTITFAKDVGIELIAVCTNVTNTQNVLQRNAVLELAPGVANPSFGRPTLYGPGRIVQLGARVNF